MAGQGLEAFPTPLTILPHERPALRHPHGIRVGSGDAAIDRVAIAGQRLQVGRDLHFIERIGDVKQALAELGLPLLDKAASDVHELRGERTYAVIATLARHPVPASCVGRHTRASHVSGWHKASERRTNGLHT